MAKDVKSSELFKQLEEDKELRQAWSANIAMAYKDNWTWYAKKTGKKVMNAEDRHIIANNAAEYFLNLLCKK
jgi:hypothetical protein